MCSAISTLSLGYSSEKKNEWCGAIVLLAGMTTQAVRFHKMKRHVALGLGFRGAYHPKTYDGRYQLDNRYLGMQYRWNTFSKAIRRGDPFIYSIYSDFGYYAPTAMPPSARVLQAALVNNKNKTKEEIFKRRKNKWNGPLGNNKRKRMEQVSRYVNREELLKIVAERLQGFWYGSANTFTYEVSSLNCLPRSRQMVRANRFLVSPLGCLPEVENILNEGGLLAFFRALIAAHMAIADCIQPLFSTAAFYLCEKRNKVCQFTLRYLHLNTFYVNSEIMVVQDREQLKIRLHYHTFVRQLKVGKMKQQSAFNDVSTFLKDPCFQHFGKVKWNREPRLFVQLGCGSTLGALGTTCLYPLQTRMQVQHSNTTYAPYSRVSLFRRSLQLMRVQEVSI